jgi:capsular polysaccharide biosynthesis protein
VTFILLLRELWRRRLLVVLVTVLAAAIAIAAVFNVSFSPPELQKRDHSEAKGSVQILVDSNRSPLADVAGKLEPLTARAGVFARYIAGGNVVREVAEKTGIPYKEIEIAGPAPLPGEAIGVTAAPEQLKPYEITVVQKDELPIVDVETKAPTVDEARALAAAIPDAVRDIVTKIQDQQQIPEGKRVTFRELGPAQANVATEAMGAKIALLLFVVLEIVGLLLILGIPRLIKAWRMAGAEDAVQAPPQLEAIPRRPDLPTKEPTVVPAEEVAGRSRLGVGSRGDG